MLSTLVMLLAAGQLGAEARKFVVANSCKDEVWAAYTASTPQAVEVGGKSGVAMWHQASGQEDEVDVPETCEYCVMLPKARGGAYIRQSWRESSGQPRAAIVVALGARSVDALLEDGSSNAFLEVTVPG